MKFKEKVFILKNIDFACKINCSKLMLFAICCIMNIDCINYGNNIKIDNKYKQNESKLCMYVITFWVCLFPHNSEECVQTIYKIKVNYINQQKVKKQKYQKARKKESKHIIIRQRTNNQDKEETKEEVVQKLLKIIRSINILKKKSKFYLQQTIIHSISKLAIANKSIQDQQKEHRHQKYNWNKKDKKYHQVEEKLTLITQTNQQNIYLKLYQRDMQEDELVTMKHISSKGKLIFDNSNIVKQRLYFLIIQYLQEDENFDKRLLQQIKNYAESNKLLGLLLSLEGGQMEANFDELNYQQRKSSYNPNMNAKDENLNQILSIYQLYSSQRAKNSNASIQNPFQQKMTKLTQILQNPNGFIQPNRELFIKGKKNNYNYNNRDKFSNDTFTLKFQHLKTCFGHAYSADSGSVNEESGEPYIPIYNTTFDKSGRFVITADEEGLIKIWSSENGLLLSNLKGHNKGILSNDISPCNKYLVTCSIDLTARVWDIFNQRCLTCFSSKEQLNAVLFYKYKSEFTDQLYLLMMSNVGNILIYKEEQFKDNGGGINLNLHPIMTLSMKKKKLLDKESSNEAVCIETHPSGYLVVGTESGEILVWDKIHTLENRNRAITPFIERREHSKNCQLIKFSPNGEYMITASFDGFAKIWPWKKLIENDKKLTEFIYSIYFDNSNKCEKNCWNVAFSCKNRYAFATFTRKMKRTKEVETVVYVHDIIEKKIKHEFTRQNSPARLQDHILVFEPHPNNENILLTADYSGQIIIYDVSLGCILNIFQERGYHIGYPNLEVPVLDGCWAPDGYKFVASTYYGSFSLYGYDCAELYKTTPTEQFFANDTEIFIYSDNYVPLSVDDEVEINIKNRGKICDFQRIPYRFDLKQRGFVEETSDTALQCIEQKMNELSLQQQEFQEKNPNNQENLIEKYLKNQEKDRDAYINLCSQLRDSYNNANNIMEGSMRVDFNERMEILKKMSKEMQKRHELNNSNIETTSNEQILTQLVQQPPIQERQIPEPPALIPQESELGNVNLRNSNRRRVIDDEDQDNSHPTHNQTQQSVLNNLNNNRQVRQNSITNPQNPRSQGQGQGRRGRPRNNPINQSVLRQDDDFGDSIKSEEEVENYIYKNEEQKFNQNVQKNIMNQEDSEINLKDMNEDDDELQKDFLEEMQLFNDPQPRRNSILDRNQSRSRQRRGEDYYEEEEEEEEKKESQNQRRTRLKRFSNNNTQNTRASTNTQSAEANQHSGTLRFNRNTRSSYSMQYSTGDADYGHNNSQENDTVTSRLRRRNQHIVEEENDDEYNHYSLRRHETQAHSHNTHETRGNTHQTRSSATQSQNQKPQQKPLRSSSRSNKTNKKSKLYDDEDEENYSESEDRYSDVMEEEEEEEEENFNYDEEDDYEYKMKKPRSTTKGGNQATTQQYTTSQNNQSNLRQTNRSLRTSNNRKKIQDSEDEDEEVITQTKQKNRSIKKNGIIDDDDDNYDQMQQKPKKGKQEVEDEEEDFENYGEEDEEYTGKKNKTYLKKRTSQEAGLNSKNKNGVDNNLVKKIKTNDSDGVTQKGAHTEEGGSNTDERKAHCERCQFIIEGEAQNCHICKKKYHSENCSKYRGCLRDKRYFCFDCYAHNNSVRTQKDEQEKRTFSREYLEHETCDPYQYVPQINDMLYYIFQGHEEYCDKYFELFDYTPLIDRLQKESQKRNPNGSNKTSKKSQNQTKSSKVIESDEEYHADEPSNYYQKKVQTFNNLDYHILPFLNHKALLKPTLCQVSSIEYVYPMVSTKKLHEKYKDRPILQLIQLKILETGEEFSLYYSNTLSQCGNFLIPQELYDHSTHFQENLKIPQQIQCFIQNQAFQVTIIEISPKEEYCKQVSEYQKLKVKIDISDDKLMSKIKTNLIEGTNLARISCWEVIHDVRRTSSPQDYPYEEACLSKEETESIHQLFEAVKSYQSDDSCYFEEAVNLKKYKHYYEFVEFPMDMSKIQRRLSNGYYRSPQSIYHDINLISSNAYKFNNSDSPICESAVKIKELLINIINNFQNVEHCLSLIVKNKKNVKQALQAFFPNHISKNQESQQQNTISIKIPQQQPIQTVPIEKPPSKLNHAQTHSVQHYQKQTNNHGNTDNLQQQQYQVNQNNNYQSYQINNHPYSQNIHQNGHYVDHQHQNVSNGFMNTGIINDQNNQYYSQNHMDNNDNYDSQIFSNINDNNIDYNQHNYQDNNDQNYIQNTQQISHQYQSHDQSQNLGQQHHQNMMGQQNYHSNHHHQQQLTQAQQRTTRSGRLTRNSSKFDYDQIDQRKN